jgi:hypothetical protein
MLSENRHRGLASDKYCSCFAAEFRLALAGRLHELYQGERSRESVLLLSWVRFETLLDPSLLRQAGGQSCSGGAGGCADLLTCPE